MPQSVNSVHSKVVGHCHANSTTPCITVHWHFFQIAGSAGLTASHCLLSCSNISHCRAQQNFNITFPLGLSSLVMGLLYLLFTISMCICWYTNKQEMLFTGPNFLSSLFMVRCKHCKNYRYIPMAKVIQEANMLLLVQWLRYGLHSLGFEYQKRQRAFLLCPTPKKWTKYYAFLSQKIYYQMLQKNVFGLEQLC